MRELKFKSDGTVQWEHGMSPQDMVAYRNHKTAVLELAKIKAVSCYSSEEAKHWRVAWLTRLIELKMAAEHSLRTGSK